MDRLGAHLGMTAGSLWVKRDDCTGLGGGGNKARKLEFLCAEALQQGCDVLVTGGGRQSNHCRMTAAAANKLGLDCTNDSLKMLNKYSGTDGGYTQENIRSLIQTLVLTDQKLPDDLMPAIFELKASLFGGSKDLLTVAETEQTEQDDRPPALRHEVQPHQRGQRECSRGRRPTKVGA